MMRLCFDSSVRTIQGGTMMRPLVGLTTLLIALAFSTSTFAQAPAIPNTPIAPVTPGTPAAPAAPPPAIPPLAKDADKDKGEKKGEKKKGEKRARKNPASIAPTRWPASMASRVVTMHEPSKGVGRDCAKGVKSSLIAGTLYGGVFAGFRPLFAEEHHHLPIEGRKVLGPAAADPIAIQDHLPVFPSPAGVATSCIV